MRHIPRFWIEFQDCWSKQQRIHPLVYRSFKEARWDAYNERRDGESFSIYRSIHGRIYKTPALSPFIFLELAGAEKAESEKTIEYLLGKDIAA